MTYNDLINKAQSKLKSYDNNSKYDIVEELAQIIVSYNISNNIDINNFDFKKFYMVLEYDWDKK